MPRIDLSHFECSVARTLEVIGDKWTLLVLRDAFYGLRRFEEFQQDLGVARNVLTDRLQRLVDAEVFEKREYQTRPPRHEYRLTQKGRELLPVVLAMMHWGDRWSGQEPPGRLIHTVCGQPTHAEPACAACGERLEWGSVRVEPLPDTIRQAVSNRS